MSKGLDLCCRWTFVVVQLFALIATFVTFGAELIRETVPESDYFWSYKWNQVHIHSVFITTIVDFYYNYPGPQGPDGSYDPRMQACFGGGRGLLAFTVLAFLCLVVAIPLSVARAIGYPHVVPVIGRDIRRYVNLEFGLAIATTLFVFLGTCIFGGTCFKTAKSQEDVGSNVAATGFAFVAVTCAFLFASLPVIYYIRSLNLNGSTASTADSADGESRRAAFASVYNQPGASAEGQPNPNAPAHPATGAVADGDRSAPDGATTKDGYQTFQ